MLYEFWTPQYDIVIFDLKSHIYFKEIKWFDYGGLGVIFFIFFLPGCAYLEYAN